MPPLQGATVLGDWHLKGPRCEVDGHQHGNVSGGKLVASDELGLVQPGFEVAVQVCDTLPAAFDDGTNLLVPVRT